MLEGVLVKRLADLGETQLSRRPMQQGDAESFFECGHLGADRGVGHTEPFRRLIEAAGLDHAHEDENLVEIHVVIIGPLGGGRQIALTRAAALPLCLHGIDRNGGGDMKITVQVKPNAKKEAVERLEDGSYLVRVNAPPIEGRANTRVIELLAGFLNVPKSRITLVAGQKGKRKTFVVE
jgi:uncharacterized protein (TIGR00251 family)